MRFLTVLLFLTIAAPAAEPVRRPEPKRESVSERKTVPEKKQNRTVRLAKRGGIGFVKALLHTDLQ